MKKMLSKYLLSCIIPGALSIAAHATEIPVNIVADDSVNTSSLGVLDCIFEQLERPFSVKYASQERAFQLLQYKQVDAYVANSERYNNLKAYSNPSAPIILQKWLWVSTQPIQSDSRNFKKSKVAAIIHSPQEIWLKSNRFNNIARLKNYEQMLALLSKDRIAAFLANQTAMENQISSIDLAQAKVIESFARYEAKNLYFSKEFLEKNRNFISEFNKNIKLCAPSTTKLEEFDRILLTPIISEIQIWAHESIIIEAINAQNNQHRGISKHKIISSDQTWRSERKTKSHNLIQTLKDKPASEFLRNIKQQGNGIYTEIFVMDAHGLNVAISDITSDYWQGDEDKFKKTYGENSNVAHLSDIEFDESTEQYQCQISIQIIDPATEEHIGAITVGVDLEAAFKKNQL